MPHGFSIMKNCSYLSAWHFPVTSRRCICSCKFVAKWHFRQGFGIRVISLNPATVWNDPFLTLKFIFHSCTCLFSLIGHYALIEHSWCSIGNGRTYVGHVQQTRNGRDCQAWASQVPHKHPFLPSKYPSELLTFGFACRNPGGVGEGPWCYTSNMTVRWEYCDVPQCGRFLLSCVWLQYSYIRPWL